MNFHFTRRQIIITIVSILFITILVITLTLIMNARFRLVSVSPESDAFPSSSNEVVFIFSQELDASKLAKSNVTVSPIQNFETTVDGKMLHVLLGGAPTQNFSLSINNVVSKSGKVITSISRSYRVQYVQYKDLSSYEKNKQIKQSNSRGTTVYPIINQLPIRNSEYIVDYELPQGASQADGTPQPLTLTVVLIDSPEFRYDSVYAESIILKVKADITSRGFNPDDYIYNAVLEADGD